MPWNLLAELNVREDWFYTPVTEDNIFKFSYNNNQGFFNIAVAQAEVLPGQPVTLFDIQRLTIRPQAEIIEIPKPTFFDQRRLAIRGIPSGQSAVNALNLRIEGTTMPLTARVSIEFPPTQTPPIISEGVSRQVEMTNISGGDILVSDANLTRKSLTIYNISIGNVHIGFQSGFLAANEVVAVLLPGDYFEFPVWMNNSVYCNFPHAGSVWVTEYFAIEP